MCEWSIKLALTKGLWGMVTDAYGRTWDIPTLWICDGSLFPTGGGANPSLTMAVAFRIGDHIAATAQRGDLH